MKQNKIQTEKDFNKSISFVQQSVNKFDSSNPAHSIEWFEKCEPVIRALVRAVSKGRKSFAKSDECTWSDVTNTSVATTPLPKVKVDWRKLRSLQVLHARRVKTISRLAEKGFGKHIAK